MGLYVPWRPVSVFLFCVELYWVFTWQINTCSCLLLLLGRMYCHRLTQYKTVAYQFCWVNIEHNQYTEQHIQSVTHFHYASDWMITKKRCLTLMTCIVAREHQSINQLCNCLCRWMIYCTSWESRYCWQRVGWRWALRWRLKCDLMSTSTSDFHQSVIASTRSSGTNASVASSSDISKVCLHSLNINDNFVSLVML